MKPQPNTKHHGWFSNPGAINAGLLAEKGIRLPTGYRAQSQLEAALLKEAEGPGRITFRIRKERPKPAAPANRYGTRLSLGQTRTFASDQEQREEWVRLIEAAAKTSNRS
jgi:hypothetical protein